MAGAGNEALSAQVNWLMIFLFIPESPAHWARNQSSASEASPEIQRTWTIIAIWLIREGVKNILLRTPPPDLQNFWKFSEKCKGGSKISFWVLFSSLEQYKCSEGGGGQPVTAMLHWSTTSQVTPPPFFLVFNCLWGVHFYTNIWFWSANVVFSATCIQRTIE